jgi:hypothetical protein
VAVDTQTTSKPIDIGLLDQDAAAALLGLKNPRTLAAWRLRRQGPRFVRIGTNVRYRRTDIEAFVASNVVDPVSPARSKADR